MSLTPKKFSELTAAVALTGVEEIPGVQSGGNVVISPNQIRTFIGARETLTANRTYYVRTDGDDANTGLVDSAGGAFLTIQKAIDVAATLDLSGYIVTIDLGNGTYTPTLNLKTLVGGYGIIVGDEVTPSNVLLNCTGSCVIANGLSSPWHLRGVKLQSTSLGLNINASVLNFQNVDFGAIAAYQILAVGGASILATGPYTISGSAPNHYAILQNSVMVCQSKTITLTGTPAFSGAFALIGSSASATLNGNTWSGAATGKRYEIHGNAVVDVGGAATTYLPGNVAGTTATGGQYA